VGKPYWEALFIVDFTFGATPVFSRLLLAAFYRLCKDFAAY